MGKGVLFREVSSVQECPHRERFHSTKYTDVPLYCYNIHQALQWYTVFNMYILSSEVIYTTYCTK